uniref:Uncharacterized protein n=1 Tax=Meloidogyne enterolobii TaxID=390850 RepID=A0A6V7Y9V6_MELEN|nr:unnamed protein product [Meloidogyne enterolobii]
MGENVQINVNAKIFLKTAHRKKWDCTAPNGSCGCKRVIIPQCKANQNDCCK